MGRLFTSTLGSFDSLGCSFTHIGKFLCLYGNESYDNGLFAKGGPELAHTVAVSATSMVVGPWRKVMGNGSFVNLLPPAT